ncbi:MAG: nucleotidyltransferase family protein [Ardenticatenia bacterium]|nr:nucleotidyltransferase family protein [Ardenticatenia bacterium]
MTDSISVLIRCLRPLFQPEGASSEWKAPDEAVDWQALLRLAGHHKVTPLLYKSLARPGAPGVPRDVAAQLESAFHHNLRRTLHLTGELLAVLDDFQSHSIRVLPYKGPALAAFLYGNLALRQFIDLDILVAKRDVLKARDLLARRGYRPLHALTPAREAALLRTNIEYVFWHEQKRFSLELHWRVDFDDDLFALGFEGLWQRRDTLALAGRAVPHPRREDLLLILCLHTYKHMAGIPRLAWFCDLAQFLHENRDMDWDHILARAATPAGRRGLLPLLWLAHDLFAAPLPEAVWAAIGREPELGGLRDRLEARLAASAPDRRPTVWNMMAYRWRLRRRMADQKRSFTALVVPNATDWAWLPLPDGLYFLYYLLRPVRLAVKYARMGADRCLSHGRRDS